MEVDPNLIPFLVLAPIMLCLLPTIIVSVVAWILIGQAQTTNEV